VWIISNKKHQIILTHHLHVLETMYESINRCIMQLQILYVTN